LISHKTRAKDEADEAGEEVSTTMSMIDRIRHRRLINRENRAIDRAWHSAPTQAMRDEIAVFAQRKVF
jgi:hypothetical protein